MKTLIAASSLVLAASAASAATLDFENSAEGDILTSFSVDGISGSISATGGSGDAMVFDTNPPVSGGDTDLAAPFFSAFTGSGLNGTPTPDAETLSPGNVLIISEDGDSSDPDDNANGGTITFVFDELVTFLGFDVFDDVANFVVTANDGAYSTDPIALDYNNQFATIEGLNWTGVKSLTFDFGRASGAIDNLRFADPTVVPVPASLPLLLAGLGALGIARRRKS